MSTSLFVEFRLQGFAKKYAKWASSKIGREAKRLGIRKPKQRRFVSHFTLFGPSKTNSLKQASFEVERVCRKYALVPFKIGGFETFLNKDGYWMFLNVDPSSELENLRNDLARRLCNSEKLIENSCTPFDRSERFTFHCSVGKFTPCDRGKFESLVSYARTKCTFDEYRRFTTPVAKRIWRVIRKVILKIPEDNSPQVSLRLFRVTVLGKKSHIFREYDLVLKRSLNRREALSHYWYKKSIAGIKKLLQPPYIDEVKNPCSVFLISDTHFDHKNIIKYCHRPFANAAEMNRAMIKNWNHVVGTNSVVYFLGDWALGRSNEPATYWMRQLKGAIRSVIGSHDNEADSIFADRMKIIRYRGQSFLLLHDPKDTPKDWQGWVIHGHVHNNHMDQYPFINGERKTINVSVEVIDYKPVSLEYILSLNLDSIKWIRTKDSQPVRW